MNGVEGEEIVGRGIEGTAETLTVMRFQTRLTKATAGITPSVCWAVL